MAKNIWLFLPILCVTYRTGDTVEDILAGYQFINI